MHSKENAFHIKRQCDIGFPVQPKLVFLLKSQEESEVHAPTGRVSFFTLPNSLEVCLYLVGVGNKSEKVCTLFYFLNKSDPFLKLIWPNNFNHMKKIRLSLFTLAAVLVIIQACSKENTTFDSIIGKGNLKNIDNYS